MPNAPIEFVLVRDKETSVKKYIPRAKYEVERDLWAQVAGGKTVTADRAPSYEEPVKSSATEGGSESGQKAAPEKENS